MILSQVCKGDESDGSKDHPPMINDLPNLIKVIRTKNPYNLTHLRFVKTRHCPCLVLKH